MKKNIKIRTNFIAKIDFVKWEAFKRSAAWCWNVVGYFFFSIFAILNVVLLWSNFQVSASCQEKSENFKFFFLCNSKKQKKFLRSHWRCKKNRNQQWIFSMLLCNCKFARSSINQILFTHVHYTIQFFYPISCFVYIFVLNWRVISP
jgi:hypothetical protein